MNYVKGGGGEGEKKYIRMTCDGILTKNIKK